MSQIQADDILAVAGPTPLRRGMALVALIFLAGVCLYVGLGRNGPLPGRILLLVLGALSLWGADMMRKSTAGSIELTQDVLRDSDGAVIVTVADITRVERGVLAFKPSNGFMIHTKEPQPRGWRLGIWWRAGRQIGIGGMMPKHQTKLLAEKLVQLIAERDPPEGSGSR